MACDVTVQICTCNRAPMLALCLEALGRIAFDPSRFEVVVVDDGSTDGTRALLGAACLPCSLRVIHQAHAGLASARNAAIRVSQGEVILFVDDDAIAEPALVAEHWRSHMRHESAVVMGRVQHVPAPATAPRRMLRVADLSTSFFWTCNASVRRRDLVAAGLFDESFVEYGWEDLEMGDRLRQLGLVRRRNSRAIVRHVKPPLTAPDLPAIVERAKASGRSAVIYIRKQPTWRARMATGITPVRRRLNRWLGLAERPLMALAGRRRPGHARAPLRSRSLAAAYLLGRIHYFRAIEAALAQQESGDAPHVVEEGG